MASVIGLRVEKELLLLLFFCLFFLLEFIWLCLTLSIYRFSCDLQTVDDVGGKRVN